LLKERYFDAAFAGLGVVGVECRAASEAFIDDSVSTPMFLLVGHAPLSSRVMSGPKSYHFGSGTMVSG
jgi:hypothetical protein